MTEPHISINRDIWSSRRMRVTVVPPRVNQPGATLPDLDSARQYADGLSAATGLPVIEQGGGGHG